MYKSVAPESKKNLRTKLIKGHTHGIPLPVGYQPPTIQQNWTERAAISPFQPILPAQVSSSQNLLEPHLFIGPSWVTTHHWTYWTTNHQSYSPTVLHLGSLINWSICLLHYRTLDRHTADYLVTEILQDPLMCTDICQWKISETVILFFEIHLWISLLSFLLTEAVVFVVF